MRVLFRSRRLFPASRSVDRSQLWRRRWPPSQHGVGLRRAVCPVGCAPTRRADPPVHWKEAKARASLARKSVGAGKSVAERVERGGRRIIKKKNGRQIRKENKSATKQ